jgi:hypothetical protein
MTAENANRRQDGARKRPGTDPARRAAGDPVNLRPIGKQASGNAPEISDDDAVSADSFRGFYEYAEIKHQALLRAEELLNLGRRIARRQSAEPEIIQSSLSRLKDDFETAERQWATANQMLDWYWSHLSRRLPPMRLDVAAMAHSLRFGRT